MSRIQIKPIPYDKYVGVARLESITKDDYKRMERVPKSEAAFFLSEAIRFYNYGIDGSLPVKKVGWKPFDPKTVAMAIEDLCRAFVEETVNLAAKLALIKGSKAIHLPSHLNDEGAKWNSGISANVGLLAAHTLIDNEYRNIEKRRELTNKASARKVYFREFEKLEGAIQNLRKLFLDKDHLERAIYDQYSEFKLGDGFLFKPYWGGSRIIKPEKIIIPGKKEDISWDPSMPIWPHEPSEIGPTEKLYFSISSSLFERVHKRAASCQKGRSSSDCMLLKAIKKNVTAVERILPPLPKKLPKHLNVWREWQDNLDCLEYLFEQAIRVRSKVWLTWKSNDYEQSEIVETHPGSLVGLPCALGLIGVLRAYIADLMGRTLMMALPRAIIKIYEDVNGYLAVQLWEALSGQDAVGVTGLGALHRWSLLGLEGQLRSWRTFPQVDPWGDKVPVNKAATETFKKLLAKPMIRKDIHNKRKSYKKQVSTLEEDVGFDDFHAKYLPRYPPITEEFYKALDIDRRNESDLLYGARFTAQAHIFVAFQILAKAAAILWWKDYNYKTPDSKELGIRKRRWETFNISAGSYYWGGRKPPHLTHRHGVHFDFNFGPDIISWPVSKLKKSINKFYKENKDFRNYMNILEEGTSRRRIYEDPLIICYKVIQVKQAEYRYSRRQMIVFRGLVRKIINEQLDEVYKFCDEALDGKPYVVTAEEEAAYKKAEKNLIGTPHFIGTEDAMRISSIPAKERTELGDWQRTYAGHVAILLSAPRNIVFASPIVHLRAMRAIRRGFQCSSNSAKLASEIVKSTYFSFMPQDHYNHWHVDYLLPWRAEARQKCEISWNMDLVQRFKYFRPVWLDMGIDMSPFLKYLKDYGRPDDKAEPLLEATAKEYDDLKSVCEDYQINYDKRFFPNNERDLNAIQEADDLIEGLFSPFQENSTEGLLNPTIRSIYGGSMCSNSITTAIKRSSKFREEWKNRIKKNKLPFDVWLMLEAFTFEEYLEVFGYQEVDESEEESSGEETSQ